MYSICKNKAFTLVELVITIAILAIITLFAAPFFDRYREQHELSQLLPMIRQQVNLAKNTAHSQHSQIVICSSSNLQTCEDDQWQAGMIIFSDLNHNKKFDTGEPIQNALATDLKYGSLTWDGGFANLSTITFQSDTGMPRGSNGSFKYCSFNHTENNRSIPISPMGNTRIENTSKC